MSPRGARVRHLSCLVTIKRISAEQTVVPFAHASPSVSAGPPWHCPENVC